MDGSRIKHYERQEPYVIVSVMGRFKGEDRYHMHLLSLINVTQSVTRIRVWLERLVALLKAKLRTNCPAFCDEEGYMLSAISIENLFHPIL